MAAAALFAGIAVANWRDGHPPGGGGRVAAGDQDREQGGLRELRAILDVLRQADDADLTQPAPGTAQMETLIDGARRSGLETTFTVTGEAVALPAAVDLTVYRIVQESLTNAVRHAGPATAVVSLGYRDGEVRIDVTDTGHAPPPVF